MLVLGQYTYVDMYLFLKDEEDLRQENTSNVLLGLQCYASHSASSQSLYFEPTMENICFL